MKFIFLGFRGYAAERKGHYMRREHMGKRYLFLSGLVLFLTVIVLSMSGNDVYAKDKISIKTVSVKNKNNALRVKLKITNNTAQAIEFGEEVRVYKKSGGKWKKIKWNEGYGWNAIAIIVLPKTSVNYTFYVPKDGLVEKLKKGRTYKIGIRIENKIYKTNFKEKYKKIHLNKKSANLFVGSTVKLKLNGAKAKKVTWKSANKKIAVVSKKGIVRAKKEGKTTITATYNGKKYKCKVTVKKKEPQLSADQMNGSDILQSAYMLDRFNSNKNTIYSPLSLNITLGMVANGASDSVRQDLENYIGKNTNDYNKEIQNLMESSKNDEMLHLANGVWYKDVYAINSDFNDVLKNYYAASIKASPFDSTTVNDINHWADDNSDGMIKEMIKELDPYASVVLGNVLLFNGKWTSPFENYDIKKRAFTKTDGTTVNVDLMSARESIYYENAYATGFEKTYGENKEYSFIGILPKKTGKFTLSGLDIEGLLQTKTDRYKVDIQLPKFTYSLNTAELKPDLTEILKGTSINSMFMASKNPICNMLIMPPNNSAYVSDVVQSCKIVVDAEGTKAAAVTVVIVKETSSIVTAPELTKKVILDRPFAYIIKDNHTGSVLFMGKVLDPSI